MFDPGMMLMQVVVGKGAEAWLAVGIVITGCWECGGVMAGCWERSCVIVEGGGVHCFF